MATSPPRLAITLPHGEVATFEEMQDYGETLQCFIREQEWALAQVQDTQRYNQIVDYLRLLASSYNEQLRLYKAAEAQRQRDILVVMLRLGSSQPWQ